MQETLFPINGHGRQYFTIADGRLRYLGQPFCDAFRDEARTVLGRHVVPDRSDRTLLTSLLFCIASRQNRWERAVGFTRSLYALSDADLLDEEKVVALARAGPRTIMTPKRENWFAGALAYVRERGIQEIVGQYLAHPYETREGIDREVHGMSYKTASFWYLCLGGDAPLLTLDTHLLRQLGGIGVTDRQAKALRRSGKWNGREIATYPGPKEYLAIEQRAVETLGTLGYDAAEATAMLWWAGAKGARMDLRKQRALVGDGHRATAPGFVSPYRPLPEEQQLQLFR